jgi:hypothetical protein
VALAKGTSSGLSSSSHTPCKGDHSTNEPKGKGFWSIDFACGFEYPCLSLHVPSNRNSTNAQILLCPLSSGVCDWQAQPPFPAKVHPHLSVHMGQACCNPCRGGDRRLLAKCNDTYMYRCQEPPCPDLHEHHTSCEEQGCQKIHKALTKKEQHVISAVLRPARANLQAHFITLGAHMVSAALCMLRHHANDS